MRHTKPDEKFPCPECPFSANSRTNLGYHLLAHSGRRAHRCDLCEKTFLLKTHLKQHLIAHTGERPYRCELCDRAFSQKPHLTRHLLTHSGERPHACGACGKRFFSRSNLQAHALTHSEEKPFRCGACGSRYHRASHLRSHVLHVHTAKGRPHVCEECGRGFRKECTLAKHREYHTKPRKKFQCADCPYSTDNRVHMETHLLHHTGERPFPCDLCDKAFQRKDRLRKHLRLVHGGE